LISTSRQHNMFLPITKNTKMKTSIKHIIREQMTAMMSRSITNRQLGAAGQRLNKTTKQPADQIISSHAKETDVKSHVIIPTQKTSWSSKGV